MIASTSPSTTSSLDMKGAIKQNGVVSTIEHVAKNCHDQDVPMNTLPKGKYTLVGIDIDTTGRRLIDEIVQLAAFTPNDHFGQYIMPYMNLNPAARQRHQIRVITIGFYRMLKSTQTYKIIKSKSEFAALKDFLDWLENLKAKDTNSQGVILVYHEERKFIPYMVLESLKKYNLLQRFLNTVKSFANGLNLAMANGNSDLKHYTLRKLSKYLMDNMNNKKIEQNNNVLTSLTTTADDAHKMLEATEQKLLQKKKLHRSSVNKEYDLFDGNASVRAKLAYEIALYLSNQDTKESLDAINTFDRMLAALYPHAKPIECDLNELQTQNKNLERQNSFRPIFLDYFKTTLYHRVRAVKFRIILAEHSYDLETIKGIWSKEKRDGVVKILEELDELKSEEKTELADLFDTYFDPAKTTMKPVVKINHNRRRNKRGRNIVQNNNELIQSTSKEQDANADKRQVSTVVANIPDSTTTSPKNQHRKRHPRLYNNKTQTPNEPKAIIGNQINNPTSDSVNTISPPN